VTKGSKGWEIKGKGDVSSFDPLNPFKDGYRMDGYHYLLIQEGWNGI
jgi:hypothetical protein